MMANFRVEPLGIMTMAYKNLRGKQKHSFKNKRFNCGPIKQCSKIRIKDKVTQTVIVSLREIINIDDLTADEMLQNGIKCIRK